MRVAVGIPSLQEADSISNVVRQVDLGLTNWLHAADCVIINVDGNSSDGTSKVFAETRSGCRKHSIVVTDCPGGKGRNVLRFFRYCLENDIDALALIDADVISVGPDWVRALLSPIVAGEADCVTPTYQRSRFEGSTTNHFAYPILYGCYGLDLRQPIGGEFGLSKSLVAHLLRQPLADAIFGYGIDIFITLHAVGASFRIKQASLGRKVHKPSFPKRSKIFIEVAATAIAVARLYLFNQAIKETSQAAMSIDNSQVYEYYLQAQEQFRQMRARAITLQPVYRKWMGEELQDLKSALASPKPGVSSGLWTKLLAAWVIESVFHAPQAPIDLLARQLMPAHLLRSITFWNENWHRDPSDVEEEVTTQARAFRQRLFTCSRRFSKAPCLVRDSSAV